MTVQNSNKKVKEIMKRITVLLILLTINFFPNSSFAQESSDGLLKEYVFGFGVIAGEPSGLTGKYNINQNLSIDGGVGWVTSGDNEFHMYGDCIYHVYDLIKVPKGKLPLYFGGGLRLLIRRNKDNKLGMRIPVGLEYQFANLPIRTFLEIVPVLNLTPDTDFDLEGGIGIRYFF